MHTKVKVSGCFGSRGWSHPPDLMGCWPISVFPVCLIDELVLGVLQTVMIRLMVVLLAFFTHGMVLVLWGVGAILGHGYGIQGQNYVEMFQRSEM